MVLIYTLMNALVKEEGKKYCFRSVVDQVLDSEMLIQEIIDYNSTITEADARAMLSVLNNRVKHFVKLGYKVELPFGYVYNKANGTVAKLNDGFLPGSSNHTITTVFKFKKEAAEEMVKDASYKQAGTGYTFLPLIKEIFSINEDGTESESLSFKSGEMLRLKGSHTSFDATDEVQGIFLIKEDKTETRFVNYNRIGSNVVEAYIPSGLTVGSYEVKLVTKPGIERYAKSLYSGKITITE